MPLDGGGTASKPAGTTAVAGATIESSKFNSVIDDLYAILNAARPVVYGGTGATSASAARTALGLAIGSDVQAYDAALASLAGLAFVSGDIVYATAADTLARLAKGTDGQFLSLASGVPAWATGAASAADFRGDVDGVLTVAAVWDAADYVDLGSTWTGNQSLDFSTFFNGYATATGNFTFNAKTNTKKGQSGIIEVTASGGTRTVSFTSSAYATPNNASLGTITSGTTVAFSYQVLNSGKVMLVRLGTV